uniref:Uncharacterized protein n=1 Tax=Anopheles atroparvus TaxID=41427 RepID=A0AAG5DR24_ANOAO
MMNMRLQVDGWTMVHLIVERSSSSSSSS